MTVLLGIGVEPDRKKQPTCWSTSAPKHGSSIHLTLFEHATAPLVLAVPELIGSPR